MSQEKVVCRIFEIMGLGIPNMESFANRLKYQKIIYLLQSFGLSLDYGFNWYLKGPYSSPLARTLFTIEATPDIYKESIGLRFKNEDAIIAKLEDFKQKLGDNINNVLYLEVLASLHYINKAKFSGKGSIDDLKYMLYDVKPHLKEEAGIDEIIEKAYKDLSNYTIILSEHYPDKIDLPRHIYDNVHGFIGITELECKVIDSPFFKDYVE
ncbi:MAG: hypothetical protein R2741_03565 [Methanolobus sp.]